MNLPTASRSRLIPSHKSINYKKSKTASVLIRNGDKQEEWVSNWAELYIEYKEDGEAVTIWANTNYLIENSKIIKSYTFYNEADAMRQLGYIYFDGKSY